MDIVTIRDWLKNFAEDPENRKQMSVNVYEQIWNEIQAIDHEVKNNGKTI